MSKPGDSQGNASFNTNEIFGHQYSRDCYKTPELVKALKASGGYNDTGKSLPGGWRNKLSGGKG